MKKVLNKKNILLILCIAVVVILLAIWGILFYQSMTPDTEKKPSDVVQNDSNKDGTNKSEEKEPLKDGIMLFDCDSLDSLEEHENIQVTDLDGTFVEGTGAYLNAQTLPVFGSAKLKESVDISEYKGGSVHLSFYVSTKTNFTKDLCFELSSSGTYDSEELQWSIPIGKVQEGWNERWLLISDAVKTGKIDSSSVNYYRFYSPGLNTNSSLDVILDNVYATKSLGENTDDDQIADSPTGTIVKDSYKETAAKTGKRVMSCNTVNILSEIKNFEVTTKVGEYLEGTGAFKLKNASYASCTFAEQVDLSEYFNEEGKMHVSLYIDDITKVTGLTYFTLSSAGSGDDETLYWYLYAYQLKSGWNELELPFYQCCMKRQPKLEAINYFRFQVNGMGEGAVIIVDDLYVSKN